MPSFSLTRLAAVAAVVATWHPAAAKVPDLSATVWKTLVWADDFDGPKGSLPNASNWIIDKGTSYPGGPANWGTGEKQTYTALPANLQLSGAGALFITPVKLSNGTWTSARIETRRADFVPRKGRKMRIEASVRLPDVTAANGAGYWPAFWALGQNFRGNYQNWPAAGEIDVLEAVNALEAASYGIHCGTNPGGPCNEPSGLGFRASCPNTPCAANYHTYTVIIDRTGANKGKPESLRFLIDGRLSRVLSSTDVTPEAWAAAIDQGHFLLLNVAMGGGFPDALANGPGSTPTAATVSGKEMRVDYVAVWTT